LINTTHTPIRHIRYVIFLKDVLILSLTCFGGPQVHLVMFLKRLVEKRRYLTETELFELQALCQILPGPTSTQTITALGFKIGGPSLAYLTLLIWALPAVAFMTAAAIGIHYFEIHHISLAFTRFIEPIAIGFLVFGGLKMGQKLIKLSSDWAIMIVSGILAFVFHSPWITPIVIILGGLITAQKYREHKKMKKLPIRIEWKNFGLWLGILVLAATLGYITQNLPIRLFENFYRNGSLVFGGGQVLSPMLYTEFVEFKHYLNRQEFLSGMALSQVVPGPVFSIASYIGALSMRTEGVLGQLLGSLVASLGIFLPGTFMIFFVYRFWDELKKYRGVRASLEGINAASVGLTLAAALRMTQPLMTNYISLLIILATVLILNFTKIPPFLIILAGVVVGLVL
jgi:chromate transporter